MLTGPVGLEDDVGQVDRILQSGISNARFTDQADLIKDFWDKKARNYFTRQFGTPDDPIVRGIADKTIKGSALEKMFPRYLVDSIAMGKTRYKEGAVPEGFVGPGAPVKETTREFCRDLLKKNLVYRVEDLDTIVNDLGSSALVWRGSYNCRHLWSRLTYKRGPKPIQNNGSVRTGRLDTGLELGVLGYPQPNTRTSNPSFSKEKFESYSDYGDGVKGNAKRGRELNEKNGNKCATQVGKIRSSQLETGEPISLETIKCEKSFKIFLFCANPP
jgi:hypothetical protein